MTRARERWRSAWPRSGDALVAVMESADLRNGDDPATWLAFDDPWVGTVLVERLVATDGGRSWRPTLSIETDVHQVLAHPDLPGHVFAASAVGLVMSADGGENWRILTEGLHARYLRAVAVAGETVLVSASTGPGGRRAAIYRTRADGHGELERCRQGLPEWFGDNVDTHCLAARGRTVVVGTGDGRVYASADEGASFALLTKGLPAIQCVALG